jgi:hypothetical protein
MEVSLLQIWYVTMDEARAMEERLQPCRQDVDGVSEVYLRALCVGGVARLELPSSFLRTT